MIHSHTYFCRYVLWLCLGLLCACSRNQVNVIANMPLPIDQPGQCCWQVLQEVKITVNSEQKVISAALAHTSNGISLVLFDGFGRKLLSIQQQGDQESIYRAPELPEKLNTRFVLASVMLAWWPEKDWQTTLANHKHWSVTSGPDRRELRYKNRVLMLVNYPNIPPNIHKLGLRSDLFEAKPTAHLTYNALPFDMQISTIEGSSIQ